MTQLLVSVRGAAEAAAALAGGAALIDVKEPAHGSLGRAPDETLAAVVRAVGGRLPVSAALGELRAGSCNDLPSAVAQLAYVKWGLAGSQDRGGTWRVELERAGRRLAEVGPRCRVVAVAYADWRRAKAPSPREVCDFARERSAGALLLDTWSKDGSTLLDWLSLAEIRQLAEAARSAGIPVALAGSLGLAEIGRLREIRPDWFAVRGAVCRGRRRTAVLDESRVRHLVEFLAGPIAMVPRGS